MRFESGKSFKLCSTGLGCCAVIMANIAIFITSIFNSVINSSIQSELIYTASNIDVWGTIPGQYDINVLRNLSLFEFLNPEQIYNSSAQLLFRQTPSVYLRENHVVSTPSFSTTGDLVSFNETLNYSVAMDMAEYNQIMDTPVNIANVYALGAWQGIKDLNQSQKAFYALGNLMTAGVADDDIYYETLALGVYVLYVKPTPFQVVYNKDFKPAGISLLQANAIYNDELYGWLNNATLKKWMQAVDKGMESRDARDLMDYFDLSPQEMSFILQGSFAKSVAEVVSVVKDNYGCDGNACTSTYLFAIQIGRQGVTLYTPPPVTPVYSRSHPSRPWAKRMPLFLASLNSLTTTPNISLRTSARHQSTKVSD